MPVEHDMQSEIWDDLDMDTLKRIFRESFIEGIKETIHDARYDLASRNIYLNKNIADFIEEKNENYCRQRLFPNA